MTQLSTLIDSARALQAAISDPPTGGDALSSAVAAVRHFPVNPAAPGEPGITVSLLPPQPGVLRPVGDDGTAPTDPASSAAPPTADPLPTAGPAGPAGDPGPAGPEGPPGPGVNPARVAALEAAIADLQSHALTAIALGA